MKMEALHRVTSRKIVLFTMDAEKSSNQYDYSCLFGDIHESVKAFSLK
jgi:hypothetical protein